VEKTPDRLLARSAQQGAELMSWGFPSLGFFRAPLSKDLASTDIACVGVPLDSSPARTPVAAERTDRSVIAPGGVSMVERARNQTDTEGGTR
jgi:hypothetical protein